MKAFILSVVAMAIITVAAAVGLNMVPMSASQVYSSHDNVRL